MHNMNTVLRGFNKRATAVLTPEAMQAAIQPPMDPSMGGMPGGAPMDPAAMGGAPAGGAPMPPADPAAGMPAGGPAAAQGSGGGQIPPEVLNDQLFMQFMQTMGVIFDPQTGTFIDPNGQALSVDEVMQIYDMFQQQVAAQGGAPGGAAPADPAMGGAPMDPAAMGAPVGDPAAMGGMEAAPAGEIAPAQEGIDPSMALPADGAMGVPAGGDAAMGDAGAAMDPAVAGDPVAMGGEDPIMEIASAVMSGVEAVLEEFTANLEKKMSALLDKVESLNKTVDALIDTTDNRKAEDKDHQASLADDLAAELQPTMGAPVAEPVPLDMLPKAASKKDEPVSLFNLICQKA